jgi:GYF domain 2
MLGNFLMSDQTTLYYLALHGSAQGPFDTAAVAAMNQAGQLPPGTLFCTVGDSAWQPINQCPALRPPVQPPVLPSHPGTAGNFGPPGPAAGYGGGPAANFAPPAAMAGSPDPNASPRPQFHVPRAQREYAAAEQRSHTIARPQDGKRSLCGGALLLALVCFFLPWLEFRCSGKTLAPEMESQAILKQTGLQTVLNKASLDEELEQKFRMAAGAQGMEMPKNNDQMMDESGPCWMAGAALVLTVVALLACFTTSGQVTTGMAAALACLLLIFTAVTGFPMEQAIEGNMKKSSRPPPGMSAEQSAGYAFGKSMVEKMFVVSYRPAFYITAVSLGIAAVLGMSSGGAGARRR